MFISGDMCMDIKCFVRLWSSVKLPKVRPAGLCCLFLICAKAACMWPVKPRNETRFADWPAEEKFDSF